MDRTRSHHVNARTAQGNPLCLVLNFLRDPDTLQELEVTRRNSCEAEVLTVVANITGSFRSSLNRVEGHVLKRR